ncbi:hypothetical protein EMIT0P176_30174 [Pseudomonas sp. IT-P176]
MPPKGSWITWASKARSKLQRNTCGSWLASDSITSVYLTTEVSASLASQLPQCFVVLQKLHSIATN